MNYQTFFQNQNGGGQQFPQNGNMQPRQDVQSYQQQQEQMRQQMMMQQAQVPVMSQTQAVPQQVFSPASKIVTSRDEAAVVTADFSGALMVFPDIAHNRVYIKQWDNNSGSAVFSEYEYVPLSAVSQQREQQQNTRFASAQDMQDLYDIVDNLMKEIDRLKKPVGKVARRNDANDE